MYQFRIRSRIFRWYGQLRAIEERLGARTEPLSDSVTTLVGELDEMEAHVEKISVPLSYADELYSLRNHIDLVRQKLLLRAT